MGPVEVLDDGGRARGRRAVAAGIALAVALVVGGALVRSTLPPPPLSVSLAGLDGSALAGDSFVRLHLRLDLQGVRALDDVRLTVAGVTQRGLHPDGLHDDAAVVQVDVTPVCPDAGLDRGLPGRLEVQVRDSAGDTRRVQLDVPTAGRLERLVRYRCAGDPRV